VVINGLAPRLDHLYYGVLLHGNRVGEICAGAGLRGIGETLQGQRAPGIKPADTPLDPTSEAWLLVLLILEAAYFTLIHQVRIDLR
jgi:hypothetical protein